MRGADLLVFRIDAPPGEPRRGAVYLARVTGYGASGGLAFVDFGGGSEGCVQLTPSASRPAPGTAVAAQVRRPAAGGKPARLSIRLGLPGALLVAMPADARRAVSRRIRDPGERERLGEVLARLGPAELGFVARTAAAGASPAALEEESDRLARRWAKLGALVEAGGPCRELLPGPSLLLRTWDELASDPPSRIVVDDPDDLREARERCAQIADPPACELRSGEPVLEQAGAIRAWERLAGKRHALPGGGRLTVESTEALVAIDVDSGRDSRRGDPEAGALAVNLEAAVAVARLLRARDLAGTIVVDFIGQRSRGSYRRITEALQEELQRDAARCRVVGISETGLLELNRQYR